ncbi:MAG: hypothetical protein K2J70_07210 [Muribaculaceae bacterium]|nr:hypothetical protein [Muribaculaceae bacterium]
MRNTLLLGFCAMIATGAMADRNNTDILPEFYSYKIAPDGKYILSRTGGMTERFDTETGQVYEIGDFDPGNGNCISADGRVMVGIGETAVLFIDGKQISLDDYQKSRGLSNFGFNGVSSEGKRIVGYVTNPEQTETMSVPFYVDLNDDGTLGEVNYLPYPRKDWMGMAPMYVYAINVSSDGKVIAGQMKDNTGFTVVPVIFRQEGDEWSYMLPTEELINPNKLALPVYPGEFSEVAPDAKDYMTARQRADYQAAMDAWEASGFQQDLFPAETDFMSEEKAQAYEKDVNDYYEAATAYNTRYSAYFADLEKIISQSVFFMQNCQAMDADGTTLAISGEIEDVSSADPDAEYPEIEVKYPLYTYDIPSGKLTEIGGTSDGLWTIPDQILSDGTIITNTPLPNPLASVQIPPLAYVVAPGTTELTPLVDYMEKFNPEGAEWLRKEFRKDVLVAIDYDTMEEKYMDLIMTGHPVVSDDWSVISGGVLAYTYSFEYSYESYVICGAPYSGISSAAPDSELTSRTYYDLSGVEIRNPGEGIYLERLIYSDGRVETVKRIGK